MSGCSPALCAGWQQGQGVPVRGLIRQGRDLCSAPSSASVAELVNVHSPRDVSWFLQPRLLAAGKRQQHKHRGAFT